MKLVSRAVVKDLANIARADTFQDLVLDHLIEQVSEDAASFLERDFSKQARVEFHQSYDQYWDDPTAQYIHLNAYPVDTLAPFELIWAAHEQHDTNPVALLESNQDYKLDPVTGVIRVRGASGLVSQLALSVSGGLPIIGYNPSGFRVTYTGGYPESTGISGTAATGAIRFAVNPEANQTITLGTQTWTFVSGAPAGLQIQILGTLALTLASVPGILNASGDAQTALCSYTANVVPDSTSWDLNVTYKTLGVAGNQFRLNSSTGAAGPVTAFTLRGGLEQNPDDPMTEVGVIQVPKGLQMLVAGKVASQYQLQKEWTLNSLPVGFITPWTPEEMVMMGPYGKKDKLT